MSNDAVVALHPPLRDDLSGFGDLVRHLTSRITGAPQVPDNVEPRGFILTEFSRRKSNGQFRIGTSLRKTKAEATPDILLLITSPSPAVVGIEAKMFDPVASIPWQLNQQMEHCLLPIANSMRAVFGEEVPSHSIALLPEPRKAAMIAQAVLFVTWSDVIRWGPGQGYYHDLLSRAIDGYDRLTSPRAKRYEGGLKGENIERRFRSGDSPPSWVGAGPGKRGKLKLLATDAWRRTVFQVN